MRTQSIFDGGFITYPTIFKKSKPVFNETSIVNKSFCLGPNRLKNGSVTNLKNNLGIVVGGIPTFKTSFFSGKNKYLYNGHSFILVVKKDIVYIQIEEGGKTLLLDSWDLNLLTKTLNIKNDKCNFITKNYVADLILYGRLQVRFNVGVDKNHGTDWKLVK
jgi:hypothetical protein